MSPEGTPEGGMTHDLIGCQCLVLNMAYNVYNCMHVMIKLALAGVEPVHSILPMFTACDLVLVRWWCRLAGLIQADPVCAHCHWLPQRQDRLWCVQ